MELVISIKQQVAYGEIAARARAAAMAYFETERTTPEAAARAAWELEGALEFDQEYEVSGEACRIAEVWVGVAEVVAVAIGLPPSDVDVELALER